MKKYLKYLITAGIGLFFTILIIIGKDAFGQKDIKDTYKVLADGFFVPGILLTCFGLLIFSSNEGTFDMLAFGVKWLVNTFKRDMKKMETFHDYRLARHENTKSFGYMCIVGLFFVAISAIFAMLYMK